jgi:hypothetical protein
MENEKVYLRIRPSSELQNKFFITFLGSPNSDRQVGFLSHSGKKCEKLDKELTGNDELGTYFDSKEEALVCIHEFYITEEHSGL